MRVFALQLDQRFTDRRTVLIKQLVTAADADYRIAPDALQIGVAADVKPERIEAKHLLPHFPPRGGAYSRGLAGWIDRQHRDGAQTYQQIWDFETDALAAPGWSQQLEMPFEVARNQLALATASRVPRSAEIDR